MKLREGVKFHNGETMTAEDVLFSLKVASESGQSMPVANIDFDKSEVVDDLTVNLAQKTVRYDLAEYLSIPMAAIFSKKGYEDGNVLLEVDGICHEIPLSDIKRANVKGVIDFNA